MDYADPSNILLNSAAILNQAGQKSVNHLKGFSPEEMADLEEDFSFDFEDHHDKRPKALSKSEDVKVDDCLSPL